VRCLYQQPSQQQVPRLAIPNSGWLSPLSRNSSSVQVWPYIPAVWQNAPHLPVSG
jgi:hypothetical protein